MEEAASGCCCLTMCGQSSHPWTVGCRCWLENRDGWRSCANLSLMLPSPNRARTASSPSSSAATGPKITLSGGESHHSSLIALWRKERFTGIAICADGIAFKAHRAALASSSGYFLSLFDSGMRDAASPTHAIKDLRSLVLEALLAFVYEGSCKVEVGLLTEMLGAAARLIVEPLKVACASAIQAQLGPCNALDVWQLADLYTLPALKKAAVMSALGGFEELPLQLASGAQVVVVTLVQEEWLVAKSEEAVFEGCVRWWEAAERPEAELLAVMKHVRFATMAEASCARPCVCDPRCALSKRRACSPTQCCSQPTAQSRCRARVSGPSARSTLWAGVPAAHSARRCRTTRGLLYGSSWQAWRSHAMVMAVWISKASSRRGSTILL